MLLVKGTRRGLSHKISRFATDLRLKSFISETKGVCVCVCVCVCVGGWGGGEGKGGCESIHFLKALIKTYSNINVSLPLLSG